MRWTTGLAVLCAALLGVNSKASVVSAPSSLDLGSMAVGTSTTATFTITGLSSTPSFAPHYGTEFALAQTSCSGTTAPLTCTVTVQFKPKYPGLRQDAINVFGSGGTLVAVTRLHGIGLGPEALLRPGILNNFAGGALFGDTGDNGPATSATLSNPQGVAVDNAGNVYISDSLAQVVRKVDTTGIITTMAGGGSGSGSNIGDGGPATSATLNVPSGLALDGAGNLYIADAQNNRVRRVDAQTQIITTVAGNGNTPGSTTTTLGDGGAATAAILYNPVDVAVDSAGNLFIADQYDYLIRRVDAVTGVITTVAGGGSNGGSDGLGDGGPATGATLGAPSALALDAAGNLYIADTAYDVIRKVSAGIISVAAGTVGQGSFNEPNGLRVDAAGNIYVSDTNNSVLWEVNGAGQMFVLAGQLGQDGYNGDGDLATQAQLWAPMGIALDASGSLYIADQGNSLVRKLVPGPSTLTFDTIAVGGITAPQTVAVDNIGNQALIFTAFGLTGNFIQQSTSQTECGLGVTVPAASSCLMPIAFTPHASGLLSGILSWQTNAQTAATQLALNGTGGGSTSPGVNISTLSFGNQPTGTTSTAQTITLTNYSTATVNNPGASISGANAGDFTTTNTCGSTLAANASCTILVTFTPSATGARNASMTVLETDSSNTQLSQSVSLQGVGANAASLTTSANVQFGAQALSVSSAAQTVTLTNSSSASMAIASVALVAGPSDFAIASNTCGSMLGANSSCRVGVTFTPTVLGQEQATLQFTDAAGNSPQSVTLQGTGATTPVLQLAGLPSPISIGMAPLGGSAAVNLTFSNTSQASYSIAAVTVSGANANEFTAVNGCGSAVASGSSCSVTVVFKPSIAGTRTASLVIAGTGGEASVTVGLSGTALAQTTFTGARSGDIRASGDFDGDGISDFVVFRPANGTWYVIPSSHPGSLLIQQWGWPGDIPVPGDYDGDGKTDFAVWRPANGTWYVIPSSHPGSLLIQQWGWPGDVPVSSDYDGDGKADFAVWRPANGTWYVIPSSHPGSLLIQQWGWPGDIPIPGDYDGDGKTDFAVWRPANGTWYVIPTSHPGSLLIQQWGFPTDIPVPGDYNGDGKTDFAVWRPGNGTWFSLFSSASNSYPAASQAQQWGLPGDIPK